METRLIIALFLILVLLSTTAAFVPTASTKSSRLVLSSSTCSDTFGGTWAPDAFTCTVSRSSFLSSGQVLYIPPGTTLVLKYGGIGSGFTNYDTIRNNGTINLNNSGFLSEGFVNFGKVSNDGTIRNCGGIFNNYGTLVGYGIMSCIQLTIKRFS